MYQVYSRKFSRFELEDITMLSYLHLPNLEHSLPCILFSDHTLSGITWKTLQNPSQIPFEKCEHAGKEESYREIQNCIRRTLRYICLSILLFTRLCLIMCHWNKSTQNPGSSESVLGVTCLQAVAHAQAQKTACMTIIISSSLENSFKRQTAAINIFCWLYSDGRITALVWRIRVDYMITKKPLHSKTFSMLFFFIQISHFET